jgi:hypothetical protein
MSCCGGAVVGSCTGSGRGRVALDGCVGGAIGAGAASGVTRGAGRVLATLPGFDTVTGGASSGSLS